MALVTTKRNVDVLPGQAAPTVFHCSQHDVGATIILGLVNAGGNFSIPSGVTAIIQGSCSNGAVFTPVTARVSESDITFNLSAEMTSIAGPTVCEAVLSKDTDVLGTANFILDVEPSAMGSDTPPVFTDAAWLWMVDKMGTETVSTLGDKTVIDAIESKLDKNQGTANAGKYLKVGADGNVENADLIDDTLLVEGKAADAKATGVAISKKLNKYFGQAEVGKYLKVGTSGYVDSADLDVTTDKTLSIADKAADAKAVGDELDDLKADLNAVVNTELIVSKNLLNLNDPDVVPNKSISTSTGLPSGTANGLTVTGFIPVTAGETYAIYYMDSFVQGIELRRVCFYNADKAYIENGYVNYVRKFTPPTGCSFARIVANTDNISTKKHGMLCVVGTASEYIPYFNPYNKYTVKNTALDTDYIRTLGGVEQVFPEWELGSYNNSWDFTDSTTEIMSDYIQVGDYLKITVAEGYTAKVYPFYVTGKRGATSPTTLTGEYVINSAETARYVRITLAKTTAETITDPNIYGLNVAIIRYGNQSVFNTHMSATPNAQDVVPSEVLPQYLALVAVKEKNVLGKVPVTVGYLYRTVTTPYKLYYAQGQPDNIKYLCDWDSSIAGATHNAPIWYSFGITDEGDIICVHRGEIESTTSERVRDNPIVYPHTDYAHPVLVELTGTKPTSWISNCGDYAESGHFFFGEYIRDGHTHAYVWDVSAPYTEASNWQIIKTYERDVNPQDPSTMVLGKIEHIHHVSRDPFSGILYVTTGDHHTEARIDYLKNGTWGILAEGDEEVCRQLNFVYTPTYIYWASDAFSIYDPETQQMVGGAHKFFRAKRDANGLIDLDNLERYSIPYIAGSIATYHVSYVKDPECILILDRQDSASKYSEIPFHVWNIHDERLEFAGQFKTARGNVAQFLGFRCECCQHYPNLYNSALSVGFSLYPNSIDVCGNPNPNIIPSQGGNTATDSVNKNQVNTMMLAVVKK